MTFKGDQPTKRKPVRRPWQPSPAEQAVADVMFEEYAKSRDQK